MAKYDEAFANSGLDGIPSNAVALLQNVDTIGYGGVHNLVENVKRQGDLSVGYPGYVVLRIVEGVGSVLNAVFDTATMLLSHVSAGLSYQLSHQEKPAVADTNR